MTKSRFLWKKDKEPLQYAPMEWVKGKPKFKAVELKVLAAIYELSLDGVSPSFRGLLFFLQGEDAASRFEGLWSYGGYASMGSKRLGRILKGLKDFGYVDSAMEEDMEYLFLFPKGREVAEAYLAKDHKRSKAPRRGAPLYRSIR